MVRARTELVSLPIFLFTARTVWQDITAVYFLRFPTDGEPFKGYLDKGAVMHPCSSSQWVCDLGPPVPDHGCTNAQNLYFLELGNLQAIAGSQGTSAALLKA